MHTYPSLQPVESTPDVLDGGHLWLQEFLTGPIIGFEMDESGLLTFGTDGREFDTAPPSLARAVRHVRQSFDREQLRAGVDDVTTFVFFGVATRYEGLDYDWDALPPFVGLDIWAESEGRFVTPDVAERVFDTIGLTPVPAFEKEVPATHFDPNSYEIPTSHWRDGKAAGVIVRNKSGGAAVIERTDAIADASHTSNETVAIESAVTCGLYDVLEDMDATIETVDVDTLSDRLFEHVARTAYQDLADGLERRPDEIRSDVGSAVRSVLREERSVSNDP